jgi:phosphoribosylglycinamide formyltransferase 2
MVTMISQNLSQFELHVRAILGLPVLEIANLTPSASHVILADGSHENVRFEGLSDALSVPSSKLRLFGKPDTRPGRRMGVALAQGSDTAEARSRAEACAHAVAIVVQE